MALAARTSLSSCPIHRWVGLIPSFNVPADPDAPHPLRNVNEPAICGTGWVNRARPVLWGRRLVYEPDGPIPDPRPYAR